VQSIIICMAGVPGSLSFFFLMIYDKVALKYSCAIRYPDNINSVLQIRSGNSNVFAGGVSGVNA